MKSLYKHTIYVIGLMLLLTLFACTPDAQVEEIASAETTQLDAATATYTPQPTATDTATPEPTREPVQLPTPIPTDTPVPTPTATHTPTPPPTATPDLIDRTCPDPPPGRPAYDRYYLAAEPWPTPVANPEPHLRLSKPLPPGFGRLLINPDYPYGYDYGGRLLLHNAIDVSEELGTPLLATADGTIVVAGSDVEAFYGWRCNWYGQLVVIEHDDLWQGQPVYSLYGHVLNINVEPGQRVTRGEQVAEVGFGGVATVRHLHFEVRVGTNEFGSTRNPMLWIIPGFNRGTIAGRLIDPEGRPWQGVTIHAFNQANSTYNERSWTYLGDPDNISNPDEHLAENFVIPDVKPGDYQIYTELNGEIYTLDVTVKPGEITQVELVTAPFVPDVEVTPEPVAEPVETDEPVAEPSPTPDSAETP